MTGAGRGSTGTPEGRAFEVVSLDARPELTLPALELLAAGWPEFMQHDPVAQRHQARLATGLAGFQVLLLDDKDELVALGVAIPVAWDGALAGLPAGWDAVVIKGVADLDAGRRPTALAALSVTVASARRGQGLSRVPSATTRAGAGEITPAVRAAAASLRGPRNRARAVRTALRAAPSKHQRKFVETLSAPVSLVRVS